MTDQPDCFGFAYDAQGKPRVIEDVMAAVRAVPAEGFVWIHARLETQAGDALLDAAEFDGSVLAALRAPETRPRCSSHADGSLMNLRGVNLNPGAEPEDMVSLRMWVRERVLVTVLMRPLQAVADLRSAALRGAGASGPAELVARLALRLADRAEPVVSALNERIDTLEETDLVQLGVAQRSELADLRRSAIVMRRYMVPQRDALSTFEIEDHGWMDSVTQSRIREATERVTRLGEELDAIRDRSQIVRDHLSDARAERMNDQMFVLSIVSALFLPLGFLTGLLGINVGGMPGVENSWAFWIVCGVMVLVGVIQWVLFKRMGLLGK